MKSDQIYCQDQHPVEASSVFKKESEVLWYIAGEASDAAGCPRANEQEK